MGRGGIERPAESPEKQRVAQQGGAESGAVGISPLVEALNLISKLPLSDIEKSEAVRRLLAAGGVAPAANNRENHDSSTVNNG